MQKDEHYLIITWLEPAPVHIDPDDAVFAVETALRQLGVVDFDVRWLVERPDPEDL